MDSEKRIAQLEKHVALLQKKLEGIIKQQGTGSPLGFFDPSGSQIQGVPTHYGLLLLSDGDVANGNVLLNFPNVTLVSTAGKALVKLLPIKAANAVYYIGLYQ